MTTGHRFLVFAMIAAAPLLAAAESSPPATPAGAPAALSRNCISANRKVDKEQKALASALDLLAKDTKSRESCSSPSMCARYDSAIGATEKRKTRHETRLARFKEDASKACKAA
jgi:hypothetical protein